jgi:hypothetical protein
MLGWIESKRQPRSMTVQFLVTFWTYFGANLITIELINLIISLLFEILPFHNP